VFGIVLLAGALGWLSPGTVDETTPNLALIVLAVLALVIAGGADNVSAIYRSTMMQAAVPDAIRGRLQGVFIVVVAGGPRIGALYAGVLATVTTLWLPPLVGGLIIIALVAVLVRLNPRFRRYDAENPEP
jgi:MFS family permease